MKNWYEKNYQLMDAYISNLIVGIEETKYAKPEDIVQLYTQENQVIIEADAESSFFVTIIDVTGREIIRNVLNWQEKLSVHIEKYGVYIVRLEGINSQIISKKIIIK